MKSLALKLCIGLCSAFAGYYLCFLSSVFYELYGPSPRFCATPQAWALQGGACIFAPTALVAAAGLCVVARTPAPLGAIFPKIRNVSTAILILCALINLLVLSPVF
ncbi:membrane hypothetical protein [Verrucomicrobia bacterium]|nr:membrane hypothetical protein [Verrucomicrobiota bacterium]